MHVQVLSADQVAAGFTRLLAFTDDLVLDCPDAVHLLALFLGRAVVDEVMPPAMLTQVRLAHVRAFCFCVHACMCAYTSRVAGFGQGMVRPIHTTRARAGAEGATQPVTRCKRREGRGCNAERAPRCREAQCRVARWHAHAGAGGWAGGRVGGRLLWCWMVTGFKGCPAPNLLRGPQVRTQIRTLLDEYNTNRDVNEVARCLGDLGVRFFHHEVVKAAIELAFAQEKVRACACMDAGCGHGATLPHHQWPWARGTPHAALGRQKTPHACQHVTTALVAVRAGGGPHHQAAGGTCCSQCHHGDADGKGKAAQALRVCASRPQVLTLHSHACAQGFKRVRDALEEEALDYGPCARSMFARLQQAGVAQGWLPAVGTDA